MALFDSWTRPPWGMDGFAAVKTGGWPLEYAIEPGEEEATAALAEEGFHQAEREPGQQRRQ